MPQLLMKPFLLQFTYFSADVTLFKRCEVDFWCSDSIIEMFNENRRTNLFKIDGPVVGKYRKKILICQK